LCVRCFGRCGGWCVHLHLHDHDHDYDYDHVHDHVHDFGGRGLGRE
jgi:hypothetical protein